MFWKKIRTSSAFTAFATLLIRCYCFLLFKTSKIIVECNKDSKEILTKSKLCIISYWHSRIFIFPYFLKRYGKFAAVVSASRDGEVLTSVIESYGHFTTRGSSRKGAVSALKGVLRLLHDGISVSITPDGPKGPRYKISGNITSIAAKQNLPIITMSFSATRAIVFNTWDRFVLPLPFSTIRISIYEPIYCKGKQLEDNAALQKLMIEQMKNLDKKVKLQVPY